MTVPADEEDAAAQAEARRRQAVRLRNLMEDYRAQVTRLRCQCEGFEGRITRLTDDVEQAAPGSPLPLLEAERDRLRGVLAEARREAQNRRLEITAEQRDLEARMVEVARSIQLLEAGDHGQAT